MAYTVVSGDTLNKIAAANNLSLSELIALNPNPPWTDPNDINPGMVVNVTSEDTGESSSGGPAAGSPEALPRGARLVQIGNVYRVVWNLGGDLGWAWYQISSEQLTELYDTPTPTPYFVYSNVDQFEHHFGNNFWGNIAEVSLSADSPWADLKERIFNQFGYVPGFDDPEIQRLLIQGYFEGWSQQQWLVEYRGTEYFARTTDIERTWGGLSESEKQQRIDERSFKLVEFYRTAFGAGIDPNSAAIQDAAFKIESGQLTIEQWQYETTEDAAQVENSPEFRRRQSEEEAKLAEGNQVENLTALAEREWRSWVGPSAMPSGFAVKWGADIASGTASEADLESYLKGVSNARWGNTKPEDTRYEDWAAPFSSQIRSTLELGSMDDNDPLLQTVLNSDLTGVDLEALIRHDDRYLETQAFSGSLSNYAEELGQNFGFIT